MKIEEKIFLIFLLVFMGLMVAFSFQYGGGARILPMVSGLFSLVIVAFLVAMAFSSRLHDWYRKIEEVNDPSKVELTKEESRREVSVVAWFLACTVLIYLLGFLIATPVFIALFLRLWAREGWVLSLGLAVAVLGVVYFAFVYLLSIPLHGGVLLS